MNLKKIHAFCCSYIVLCTHGITPTSVFFIISSKRVVFPLTNIVIIYCVVETRSSDSTQQKTFTLLHMWLHGYPSLGRDRRATFRLEAGAH